MKSHFEKVQAKNYYGPHASGVVVLVSGQPHHFTGRDANAEADAFIDDSVARIRERRTADRIDGYDRDDLGESPDC